MTAQRILLTALCMGIVGTVISSGDAEARNRCRRGYANGGLNSGYGYNSGSNFYGNQYGSYTNQGGSYPSQSGYVVNPAMNATNATTLNGTNYSNIPNQQWNAATQQWVTTPANQGVIQTNGTYSVSKPITNEAAPQPVTAPFNNNIGNPNFNNQPSGAVQQNTSPDVDNEGRGASKIQGTAPSKAPLPAATTNP